MLKTTKNIGMEHYKEIKTKGIVFKDGKQKDEIKIKNVGFVFVCIWEKMNCSFGTTQRKQDFFL